MLPENVTEKQAAELLSQITVRPCSECTACCEVIGVSELRKPYYAKCEHCTTHCTIYETRPKSCGQFHCMWTIADNPKFHALFKEPDRPDRSGFIFDVANEVGLRILDVYEARNVKKEEARSAIRKAERINKKLQCEVIRYTPYRARVPVHCSIDPKYGVPEVKPGPSNYWITKKDGQEIYVTCKQLPKHLSFLE